MAQGIDQFALSNLLDNSKYSSAKELKKWDSLVSHLPPSEREAAAKELNRPVAAAKLAAEGGENRRLAMLYINKNPALRTALDTAQGGKADEKITTKDLKHFANNMNKKRDQADRVLQDYRKDNPDADPQSLALVRSSALLLANEPLLRAANSAKAAGAADQKSNNGIIESADLHGLIKANPGLSPQLRQAAQTWAQPGMFSMLEHGSFKGKELATNARDKKMSDKDIREWIKDHAPTNGAEFSDTIHRAATLNAVANVDISRLNENVFAHPEKYSAAEKAAVLVKLQQTQEQVIAGRSIRNTEKTEAELERRIGQLQNDPYVRNYLDTSTRREKANIVQSDPALTGAVNQQLNLQAATGQIPKAVPATGKKADADNPFRPANLLDNAEKLQGDWITKKSGVGLTGRIAGAVAGRVVGAVAGQAAGAAAAATASAAAGPVGWAVSAAMSIGMGIGELVNFFKRKKERSDFDHTVHPILEQFKIAKPK